MAVVMANMIGESSFETSSNPKLAVNTTWHIQVVIRVQLGQIRGKVANITRKLIVFGVLGGCGWGGGCGGRGQSQGVVCVLDPQLTDEKNTLMSLTPDALSSGRPGHQQRQHSISARAALHENEIVLLVVRVKTLAEHLAQTLATSSNPSSSR